MSKMWYERSGEQADVVLSSRVRFARNIEGYPFEGRLSDEGAKEIIEKIGAVLTPEAGFTKTDFTKLTPVEIERAAENYTVSNDFAAKKTPHALFSCDADGGEAMAYASLEACRPFISPITVNGHHLVDFGGYKTQGGVYDPSGADELYGPAAYLLIGKTNNLSVATALGNSVCEMFVVMQAHAELSNNFFVSPLGNNSGYQIPMTFLPDTMFRSDYSRTTYGGYSNTKSEGDYRA